MQDIKTALETPTVRNAILKAAEQYLKGYKPITFTDLEGSPLSKVPAKPPDAGIARVLVQEQEHILQRLVEAQVLPLLQSPAPVTFADIRDSFVDHLMIPSLLQCDLNYRMFVESVNSKLHHYHSEPFNITANLEVGCDTEWFPLVAWENASFQLKLIGTLADEFSEYGLRRGSVYGQLEGNCTESAMAIAAQEVGSAIDCLIDRLSLSRYFDTVQIEEDDEWFEDDVERHVPSNVFKRMITRGLDLYFLPWDRKDTLQRRLRNALHFMAESDGQTQPAVKLALSFAAIEAMVCRKREGIVDELSRSVATLLQHDSRQRLKAIRAVKALYNTRSKILHGEQTEAEGEEEQEVRLLSGGVFRAVLEWEDFSRRLEGETTDRKDFFEALDDAAASGREVVGVPDSLSHCLPPDREP